jgi:hypothetical protein
VLNRVDTGGQGSPDTRRLNAYMYGGIQNETQAHGR